MCNIENNWEEPGDEATGYPYCVYKLTHAYPVVRYLRFVMNGKTEYSLKTLIAKQQSTNVMLRLMYFLGNTIIKVMLLYSPINPVCTKIHLFSAYFALRMTRVSLLAFTP